jgi:hypothetical protein
VDTQVNTVEAVERVPEVGIRLKPLEMEPMVVVQRQD